MKVLVFLLFGAVSALMAQQQGVPGPQMIAARMMDSERVVGSPYSAQAVTETEQTSADGNRVSHQSSSMVYRDGQGRQRREINVTIGDTSIQSVLIVDPVARATWLLTPSNRAAGKTDMPPAFQPVSPPSPPTGGSIGVFLLPTQPDWIKGRGLDHGAWLGGVAPGGPAERAGLQNGDVILSFNGQPVKDNADLIARVSATEPGALVVIDLNRGGEALEVKMLTGMRATVFSQQAKPLPVSQQVLQSLLTGLSVDQIRNSQVEDLGTQSIEGVIAQGTRVTTPAAANIVNEVWYSADLKAAIVSKHSDPRTGNVTYRLTNIVRSEPDPSLFEVPADYTVTQRPGLPVRAR